MYIKGHRGAVAFLAAGTLAGGMLTMGMSSADAAAPRATGVVDTPLYNNLNQVVGHFQWSANPNGTNPGDAFRVKDSLADGWGIEADFGGGRYATTAGHNSPYTSPWSTGNLPEHHTYRIPVSLVRNGTGLLLEYVTVTS